MVRIILLALLIIVFSSASTAMAVQVAPRITDREIIEGLANMRGDIKNLKGDIQGLREEVKDIRGEIKGLRGEIKGLRGEIKEIREEIKRSEERMEDRMMWGFGLLFSGMLILVGFILWDRRTTLAPVVHEMKEKESVIVELKKQMKEAIDILRGYAQQEPKLAGLMRAKGLL